MKVKYFTAENFDELHIRYRELMLKNKPQISEKFENNISNQNNDLVINEIKDEEKKKSIKLETLEDYEKMYLFNGIFIYPDSLPFHFYNYGVDPEPISEGEKEYLKKYEYIIKEAKKYHIEG